jgi:ribosomal protein S8
MISKTYFNFFNILKLHVTNKKLFLTTFFSIKILNVIKILKLINAVRSYYIIKKNNKFFIKIYFFYYKQLPILTGLKLLATPSKVFLVSYKSLQLIQKKTLNSIFLIHTSKGIITHTQALQLKIGGRFLAQLTI